MNVFEVIERVESLGGSIRTEDDSLVIRAPKGVIDEELKRELLLHKSEILSLEHWDYQKVRVPNQMDTTLADVWMVGTRLDDGKKEYRFWFVRTERKGPYLRCWS